MQSNMKFNPESVERYEQMRHVLEQGSSSTQKKSLPAAKMRYIQRSLPFLEGCKVGRSVIQTYPDLQKPGLGHTKSEDKELVRNMSSIPGFLQHVEKENSIQEKALNFGVLDWKHLEKWKYMERMPGNCHKKTSFSGQSLNKPPEKSRSSGKRPTLHNHDNTSSYSGRKTILYGSHFSLPQRHWPPATSHLSSSKKERNATWDKMGKNVLSIMPKGREGFNQEYEAAEISSTGLQQDHLHPKFGGFDRGISQSNVVKESMENLMKKIPSREEVPSSLRGKHKSAESEMRFHDVTSQCCAVHSEIPKQFLSGSGSSQSNGSRTSFDGQLDELTGNRLSDYFSPQEHYSTDFYTDIPHPCPLSFGAADQGQSIMEQHNEIGSDTPAVENYVTSLNSKGKCPMIREKTSKPSSLFEGSRMQPDITGETSMKGKAHSPAHRFSFSLGRMSRSASLKERSEVPQLISAGVSVGSGPLGLEFSPSIVNIERDHANTNRRGRSSPLRRLLDPLLKGKIAQSAETVVPLNGSVHPTTVRTKGTKGPSQNRKPEVSKFQALLQLSLKNGLPFFKLVVENSNDMLAAAMLQLPASGEADTARICTFYSISEIKKKSMSWINQGSNNNACSLLYTLVGQMKISDYCYMKVSCRDSSECSARKCILYGVDPGQENKQTVDFVTDREIAAIIIGDSSNRLNLGQDQCGSGTVVILPGGIHGLPIKGAHSSLISRWESGGLCDCGGWDVGCQLRILADYNKSHENLQESMPSSAVDHLNLFVQGLETKTKHFFSMEPMHNGFYSIAFDDSVPVLEAFSTCVAYLTCRKYPEMIDAKVQSNADHFAESILGTDKKEVSTTFQMQQLPAKYTSCPPLSPAGRI